MRRCLLCGMRPRVLGRKRHDAVHELMGRLAVVEMSLGLPPGYWKETTP